MGFTYVKVRVSNPLKPEKFNDVDLLVDSGAVFTSIPREVLEELGLSPVDRERLRVYGGAILERDIGWALIEYGGKRRVVPVIFGEKGDTPVLGATSLEALGYQVDPVTRRLKPVELLMV
uniref:Aspartyl protease n=1 Tax=Thermofilum pendens TaxID=2269 RepID=A0A7J3X849_THEPE